MTSPVVLLQSPFMFCCCAAVSGIDQFGSVIPHFVFPSIPWFSGLPSSSETSFQKFLLGDSVVENAYYIPSPMFRTLSSHLFLGFPACLLPPRLPSKNFCWAILLSKMLTTFPAQCSALRLPIYSSVFQLAFFLRDFLPDLFFLGGILLSKIITTCPAHCYLSAHTCVTRPVSVQYVQFFIVPCSPDAINFCWSKYFFFFLPIPPHVLMNFRGFPHGCGDSVADF